MSTEKRKSVLALRNGAASITGAVTLSLASVEDMLTGLITPKEAIVVNKACGHVLSGCALHLRYASASHVNLSTNSSKKTKKA